MNNKIVRAVAAVALVIVGFFAAKLLNPAPQAVSFSAIGTNPVENYIPIIKYNEGYYSELPINTTAGITIGTNGTSLAAIKVGNCTIWAASNTIAATSTVQAVCQSATNGTIGAITGVTADAICNVKQASSTNATIGGLVVEGVSASSTAGTIVTQIANFTGAPYTWTAAASSSSQWTYSCFDPA